MRHKIDVENIETTRLGGPFPSGTYHVVLQPCPLRAKVKIVVIDGVVLFYMNEELRPGFWCGYYRPARTQRELR